MAINYTYPVKGSPVTTDEFLIIDSADDSTKKVTVANILALGQGEDVGVATITVTSPIVKGADNRDVALSLGTVPVSKGGTNLTAIGSAHQALVVNNGGTALEYKDVTIIERVKNTTASTITKGTPVHATGWSESDGAAEVEPANATNGLTDLMPCIGIAEEDIAVGEVGPIIVVGVLESITTNAYGVEVGDVLYVAPGGGLTGTRPTGTNIIQPVAVILKKAGSGGGVLQVASVSQGASIPNVQSGEIIIGNASNVGESVAMSGEVTITNTGVTEVTGIDGNISIQGYSPVEDLSDAAVALTDEYFGKTLVLSNATTTATITEDAGYPIGTEISLINSAGSTTIVVDGGNLNGNDTISASYGQATLKKIASTEYVVYGDLVA